jgi:hypothetical protein
MMINKISISLILLLFIASCASTGQSNNKTSEKEFERHFCTTGWWGIFLPDAKGNPASNIKLMRLQHYNADDKCGRDMTTEQMLAINKDVMPIAASAFGTSKAQFEVMVRFTLTPEQPSTVEMKYQDDGTSELLLLDSFHRQLEALTNYHSKKGTTYVVFHYAINKTMDNTERSGFSKELSQKLNTTVREEVNQLNW